MNRPTLARAVQSVLDQHFRFDDFEIVVVNDSGQCLRRADWQGSDRVRVIETDHRERSVARNTGAAVAKGEHLHFLDDDDVILPGAFDAFWRVAQKHSAAWMLGDWQTVDDAGQLIQEFRPSLNGNISALLVAGEGLPLQASLVRTDSFFQAGGFDVSPAITGVEDRDLGRRLALLGSMLHVPAVVARVRVGEQSSTTPWSVLAERDRWGREQALCVAGSSSRLRASAESPYWRGRLCRAYCASMVWNLQRRNLAVAIARGFAALQLGGTEAFSPKFWVGLRTRVK